jgi:hypothetical protein
MRKAQENPHRKKIVTETYHLLRRMGGSSML